MRWVAPSKRLINALLAALCLASVIAHAQPTDSLNASRLWINAGFYSAHVDRDNNLRNPTPGLGREYRLNSDWSLTAGRFTNSDDARSNYVGAYYQPWTFTGARWGVVAGAFNGYPKAFDGGWFPALIPTASW